MNARPLVTAILWMRGDRSRRLAVACALCLAASCARKDDAPVSAGLESATTDASLYFLDTGLTAESRKSFYRLAEGSEVLPLSWFRALNNLDTARPFLENAQHFGLIPDPYSVNELPIGLSTGMPRGAPIAGDWVGVNCAACHVGKISNGATSYLIDGAPSMFDIERFYEELANTALRTATNGAELWGWLRRLTRAAEGRVESPGGPEAQTLGQDDVPEGPLVEFLDRSFDELKNGDDLEREFAEAIDEELRIEMIRAPSTESAPEMATELWSDDISGLMSLERARSVAMIDLGARSEVAGSIQDALAELLAWQRLLYGRYRQLRYLAKSGDVERTAGGPGRTDAFGRARNQIFEAVHGSSYRPEPITAPVSYPSLWGFSRLAWLHWNANTTSILTRNIGQAIGVGAILVPNTHETTVQLSNLERLEEIARSLTAPQWPFSLDQELASEGREIYAGKGKCASCHDGSEKVFLIDRLERQGGIETDPLHAHNFDKPVNGVPFHEALREQLVATKQWLYAEEKPSAPGGEPTVESWRSTRAYPARPLDGIWSSAPYLHNGSVPTLHDLLTPPGERPISFYVGFREYDLDRVGYRSSNQPSTFFFDTRTPGNHNRGHHFGTDLSPEERRALIEYLKTL